MISKNTGGAVWVVVVVLVALLICAGIYILAVRPDAGPAQPENSVGSDAASTSVIAGATSTAGEQGEDGKYIGYIRSITPEKLVIDYVQWISPCPDDSCPNGYTVINDNPKLRTLGIAKDARIVLQTYSHATSGSFNWDEEVPLARFVSAFNDPAGEYPANRLLFWVVVRDGVVTSIAEQYRP